MKISLGKEWKELRRFENLELEKRSIVFYAENKASINHFRLLINELTEIKKFQICYVTSVKDDQMLLSKNKNIFSFYIGKGVIRTKFFLTLKAKILIMDMCQIWRHFILKNPKFFLFIIYTFFIQYSAFIHISEKVQLIIMIRFFV